MKRWTLRIFFCLVLGAVTTVGVAWGCAIASRGREMIPVDLRGYAFVDLEDQAWQVFDSRRFGLRMLASYAVSPEYVATARASFSTDAYARMLGAELFTSNDLPNWSRTKTRFSDPRIEATLSRRAREWASGWPALAVHCTVFADAIAARQADARFTELDGVAGALLLGGAVDPNGMFTEYVTLPLRPIFPGFLIDTLFYAVIWFGLFFGAGSTRRAIRRRRGRCPKCAYDLRGQTPHPNPLPGGEGVIGCPECGWNRLSRAG